jgi:hypothetical protein
MIVTDSTTNWVAGKFEHDAVSSINVVENNLIQLVIDELGPVLVAVMALQNATLGNVPHTARRPNIEFILNVPKSAVFQADLIHFASVVPVGLGGMGDLARAINQKELRSYLAPERKFIMQALTAHDAVACVAMLNNNTYLIHRHTMNPYQILAINAYDVTAAVIRESIQTFGKSRTILVSNPNARTTPEAKEASKSLGIRIVDFRQLLGALNS